MSIRASNIKPSKTINLRLSRPMAVASIVATWTIVLVYDIVTQSWALPVTEVSTFRLLLPLIGLAPAALRLLLLEEIDTDQNTFRSFRNLTIAALVTIVLTAALNFAPFSYSAEAIADTMVSLFVARIVVLAMLVLLPWLVEPLIQLYGFRTQGAPSRMPRYFAIALLAVCGLAQLAPLEISNDAVSLSTPITFIGALVSLAGLVLATRGGWIINLRKEQKWSVAGLAALGFAVTMMMSATVESSTDGYNALLSFAPGLVSFVSIVFPALCLTYMVIFVSALVALPTAGVIDRRNTEVSSLTNLAQLLTQSIDADHVIDTAIAIACDATGAKAAWIELREGEAIQIRLGRTPRITLRLARQLMTQPFGRDQVVAQAVARERRVVVVDKARQMNVYRTESSPPMRSVAAAPLISGDGMLGAIYVAKNEANGFDRRNVLLLQALADQIAFAIEQSRLIRTSLERERFEQEMLIARDLQERLLPKHMPSSPLYEIYAESLPASLVGGDYYDVVAFADNTLGLLVADVSGKGASAALYMGMIKGIVQALSGQCSSPKELLARTNVALHGNIDQRSFATMTCAQIVEERRTLRIARAGHCPTLLLHGTEARYSKPSGLGLAIAKPNLFDRNLQIEEVAFSPGDYAIFFSDGLPEARSPEGEELGYERLMHATQEAARRGVGAAEMRAAIFERIDGFTRGEPLGDDSTLVILRWR